MSDQPIEKVVIVGDGIDGWTAAAALACAFRPERLQITVVKYPTPLRPVSALEDLRIFNRILGLNDQTFIQRTGATFKLGVRYENWNGDDSAYFVPFGRIGAKMDDIPFYQFWLKAHLGGEATPLWRYSLSGAAAQDNKFGRPANNTREAFAGLSFSFHADGAEYLELMCDYALAKGVSYLEDSAAATATVNANGFIDAVRLTNGDRIEGDFFIDCTGVRRLLMGEALSAPFQSWGGWLPCNRAAVQMCDSEGVLTPYTVVKAEEFGWVQTTPLQHSVGRMLCFSYEDFSDNEAAVYLSRFNKEDNAADPTFFDCEPGRLEDLWRNNCVAVGEAAGVVEDIDTMRHSILQKGVTQLVQLFPDKTFSHGEKEEYNRLMRRRLDGSRDLAILHYHANGRNGAPFWKALKEKELPKDLGYRLNLFKHRGRLAPYEDDPVSETQWLGVLLGQHVMPAKLHPLVDIVPDPILHQNLTGLRQQINDAVSSMVPHSVFVENASRV